MTSLMSDPALIEAGWKPSTRIVIKKSIQDMDSPGYQEPLTQWVERCVERVRANQSGVEGADKLSADNIIAEIDYERGYYDSVSLVIKLHFEALESDEEYCKRLKDETEKILKDQRAKIAAKKREQAAEIAKEENDRKEFERLKKKYGVS